MIAFLAIQTYVQFLELNDIDWRDGIREMKLLALSSLPGSGGGTWRVQVHGPKLMLAPYVK